MGALHEGHLSLVKEARRSNDFVVVSIYVNPTQFEKGEDVGKYPRSLERDTALLGDLGVDHVFAPENMYGTNHVTFVDPTGFDHTTEGKARPGHFRGVATVITKLFNIVRPTNAYFGQKDAAQCALVRRIADDLDTDVSIRVMDILREPEDGLAMSSRNVYLSGEERDVASVIYRSLCAAKRMYEDEFRGDGGFRLDVTVVQKAVMDVLESEPLVSEVQYVSIDNKDTMAPLLEIGSDGAVVSIACKIGTVRLIDNIIL